MKKSSFVAGCVAVASLALSGPVLAHHGDAGRYIEEVVEITGTVVETQLINPPAILVVDVMDPSGKRVRWQAEMGGAQGLIRGGWTSDVKPGTRVTSHQFHMGDWDADETFTQEYRNAYLWIVPADVAGEWRLGVESVAPARSYRGASTKGATTRGVW